MIKFFWNRLRHAEATRQLFAEARCARDPLAHPVLKAMSAAEFADIPFPRWSELVRQR